MPLRRGSPSRPEGDTLGGTLAAAGLVLLMVACCAGPALLAAGGLSLLGAVLHRPWLLAAAALALLAAIGLAARHTARRDRGGAGGGDPVAGEACCPPGRPPGRAAHRAAAPGHGQRDDGRRDPAAPDQRTAP